MSTFFTELEQTPEALSKKKSRFTTPAEATNSAETAPDSNKRSPGDSSGKTRVEDEAAQREERIHRCIEMAINDDLNLTNTLKRLEYKEGLLNDKLRVLNNLSERLQQRPDFLNAKELHEVGLEQRLLVDGYRKELEREYQPVFENQRELIMSLPENILSDKYKSLMISSKDGLKRKIIDTEVEIKKEFDFSVSSLMKAKKKSKVRPQKMEYCRLPRKAPPH